MIRTINLRIHEATVGWIALHSWNECITLAPKKTSTKGVIKSNIRGTQHLIDKKKDVIMGG